MKLKRAMAALAAFGLCAAPVDAAVPILWQIPAAENQLTTEAGRWFISGDGAVYEGSGDGNGFERRALPARRLDGTLQRCYFLGMAERHGRLYTICTDAALNPFAIKRLFSLDLSDPAAELREIYRPSGLALPNGLAVDAAGDLVLADSGAALLPGRLVKLRLDSHGQVTEQLTLHQFPLCKPNGVRIDGERLYVSLNPLSYVGVSQLKRYHFDGEALRDGVTIYDSWGFIDDFALTRDGVAVAEFLGGKVSHVREDGTLLKQAWFDQPTSVSALAGGVFPGGGIRVTERGHGRVVVEAEFGAWPR
ncbi:SMP-30/gluconolactonase/LRE family protein [Chitinimonas lacunae]|uniref:SMP-30/gluconolactonase/LRE family protein n=1 Tax=Chitinimonas lacunae TaxID=1963018 RepID=A0ABV8MMP2_9NEIS